MKIAISAEGPDLQAEVGQKLGISQYLLIVDLETMNFEAVPNPGATAQRGAGMQAVVLAISNDVEAVLTGFCSPAVKRHLSTAGIEILTGISGTVKEAVDNYKESHLKNAVATEAKSSQAVAGISNAAIIQAIRNTGKQLVTLLPMLIGVVLLIGLFSTFIPKELLSNIFSGHTALDTLWGACFGSILAGNPINSYIIGGELLKYDISLFAVTALIVTWVTVGLVQLPAEIAALGKRFALLRNGLSFVLSIPIAMVTVQIMNIIVR